MVGLADISDRLCHACAFIDAGAINDALACTCLQHARDKKESTACHVVRIEACWYEDLFINWQAHLIVAYESIIDGLTHAILEYDVDTLSEQHRRRGSHQQCPLVTYPVA